VVSLPAGVFKPYAGVETSVLVFRRPAAEPAKGKTATRHVWFYEVRNDGYDPDKIQGGGRPETPDKNDIPELLAKPVPDEDPAVLIREVLTIEKEITDGLEKLLKEVES
jgi:hypothetical protein